MKPSLQSLADVVSGRLYRRSEAAAFLGRHLRTIAVYNRTGKLPAQRIGGRYGILGQDILALAGATITRFVHTPMSTLAERQARGRAVMERIRKM